MVEPAAHAHLTAQMAALEQCLVASPAVRAVLDTAATAGLMNWYLGAGAVGQTVWNSLCGFAPLHGIRDFDVVYFDSGDLSIESELRFTRGFEQRLPGIGTEIEVKNEARVHLWYEQKFGVPLE